MIDQKGQKTDAEILKVQLQTGKDKNFRSNDEMWMKSGFAEWRRWRNYPKNDHKNTIFESRKRTCSNKLLVNISIVPLSVRCGLLAAGNNVWTRQSQ